MSDTTPATSGPVRRTRRATSAVATPAAADTAGPDAAQAPPEAAPGEAAPRTTRSRRKPAATAPAPEPAEPVAPGEASASAEAPVPARRSRRATSPATSPAPVETAPEAAPDKPAARRSRARSAPAPVAEEAADAAPVEAAPRRRTTKKATVEPPAEPAATEVAPADAEPAPVAPRRSRRRATSDGTAPAAVPEETPETAKPASRRRPKGEAAARSAAPAEETPARPAKKSSRKRPTADATEPAPERAAELDVLAELGPVRTTTGGGDTRLAATALLFQAPDPAKARPARRRAQAPAGPPVLPVEDAEEELETEDLEATDEAADETVGTTEEPSDAEEAAEDEAGEDQPKRRRRRGGRGRRGRGGSGRAEDEAAEGEDAGEPDEPTEAAETDQADDSDDAEGGSGSSRRRRRRRSRSRADDEADTGSAGSGSGSSRPRSRSASDEVTALKGSTRLEAKRQRRREGRDAGRRRTVITEAEFLARREAVDRDMIVRERAGRVQIAVLEDGVLVEHFVSRTDQGPSSMVGNVYLGRVQNVLPSMEAAFVDVGKGRNAVLYAGEVNWDAAGLEGQPRRIEQALKSGDSVLVQVTKDPIGHKGARLTSQVTLAGRYLVYVPGGGMTGISRKLPDTERVRLKKILKEIVPDDAGVIVRTAAEGASEEELRRDVARLQDSWAKITKKQKTANAPAMLLGEPDLAIRVVRDIFNDDFRSLVVQGDGVWDAIHEYVDAMAPDLAEKVSRWTGSGDVFAEHRIDEQLAKGMDRKVWLPSGGSLVIDRTEAMTVVDVNTGKFTGSGGTLEETVTRNNLEAAEEIVRQLRLRDIGGIIVIDFIDMVLESNRDLVLRRLVECLGRDRTKHQVAEVTSLGLVQMTRKRVGQGLVEAFSETCAHCNGRGFLVHTEPEAPVAETEAPAEPKRSRRKKAAAATPAVTVPVLPEAREAVNATLAAIAAAAANAHAHEAEAAEPEGSPAEAE